RASSSSGKLHLKKFNLISCEPLAHVSDIKLIRTDTTLDLSQKVEKGMICSIVLVSVLYHSSASLHVLFNNVVFPILHLSQTKSPVM
ncbi:Serine/threonine-protein kinase ZRK7, partial [Linum perenne]